MNNSDIRYRARMAFWIVLSLLGLAGFITLQFNDNLGDASGTVHDSQQRR